MKKFIDDGEMYWPEEKGTGEGDTGGTVDEYDIDPEILVNAKLRAYKYAEEARRLMLRLQQEELAAGRRAAECLQSSSKSDGCGWVNQRLSVSRG